MKTPEIIHKHMQRHYSLLLFIAAALLSFLQVTAQKSELISAVKNNDINGVKRLLEAGADPNAVDDDSDNVLMNAAMYASVECMNALLQKKADPNIKNKHKQTALMYCTNNLEKCKLLLQYGADINAKSKSGNTPLLVASVGNQPYEMVKFLLDNKADPLATNAAHETALMRAAQFSDTTTLRLLISKGINVNALDYIAGTALTKAILNANSPAVSFLLNNGADPNIVDSFSAGSLAYAVLVNDNDLTKEILNKTSDVNKADVLGMTPLMWAVYSEYDRPETIQALLDHGAQINTKSKDGSTALSWAIKKGNTATVALLKKLGAQ
ncbi:hypothetical protein BH10BAC3_BH10BAC3_28610 [soil metagenome]